MFAVTWRPGRSGGSTRRNLEQTISVVCCGWESRGVALGDGKVYLGQLDGSLVALDQKTGEGRLEDARDAVAGGYSITARRSTSTAS